MSDLDKLDLSKLDMKMNFKKGHLVIVMLMMFLIAGLMIGFMTGGLMIQKNWENFFDLYKANVERDCLCVNTTVPINFNNQPLGYSFT